MSKRRTRKQKEKAKHVFTFHWTPSPSDSSSEASVKREFVSEAKSASRETLDSKDAKFSAKVTDLNTIRKDITKSLILAGLILASEVVIYFIWS